MEIAEHCPASIETALSAVRDGVVAEGATPEAVERGLAAGRLVGALTEDAPLAIAVLAYESLSGDALARPALRALRQEPAR